MVETGMRPEKVYRIHRENVYLDKGYLFNSHGKTKAARRKVWLNVTASAVLSRRLDTIEGNYVFPGRVEGKPIVKVNNAHTATLKRCGVAHFTLYSLRHTWATRAAESGVDLVTPAAMLRHSKINIVLRRTPHRTAPSGSNPEDPTTHGGAIASACLQRGISSMTETTKVAVISSIITGAFSLFVAIIKSCHGEILSLLRLRKRRIQGTWRGQRVETPLSSNVAPFQDTYDISIELQQIGSRIKGKGMGKGSSGKYHEAKLKGKMEDEHFVTLSAHAISPQEFDICLMLF
jgi:hypothetical protein